MITLDAAVRAKSGIFSTNRPLRSPIFFSRPRLQKSHRINAKGSVTSIGLDISPRAKNTVVTAIQSVGEEDRSLIASLYLKYASIVSIQNTTLKTSRRSATHATDSTCVGCTANRKAIIAAWPTLPVRRLNAKYASTDPIQWNRTLAA